MEVENSVKIMKKENHYMVNASLSKRDYIFQAYVFEDYVLVVLLTMHNAFGDNLFVS
jgi:hypothetical protein